MKINHASVPCWQSSKFILSLIKFVHCSHVVVQIKVDRKPGIAVFTLENPIFFVGIMH